jgi:wyosine [tRNA(Phe)-imidazoG37] synthetase (radical SAM superfamily)
MIAFGPIPSRRFGKSLGINNISSGKACSYSCVYCQLGRTKDKSVLRKTFYDPATIYKEVNAHINHLDLTHMPDCLTIVPNGEPTLDINLGDEIRLLKKFDLPVGVITNASLLFEQEVREALMQADQVCIKVDAIKELDWKKINRPAKQVDFRNYLEGLQVFAESFSGKLFTETMLVDSLNDSEEEIYLIANFITNLKPDVSYLLTPTRPPAERSVSTPSKTRLNFALNTFKNCGLKTELLDDFEGDDVGITGNAFEDILNISAVHPIREDVMQKILKLNHSSTSVLESLIDENLIKTMIYQGNKYYVRDYHV